MAESGEHSFISETFIKTLEAFSKTRLYTYRESARKAFDFSCTLIRDQTRPLVGQTLWKHKEGIDKDLRHLLLDEASSVKVYLCRDLMKNKSRIEDALSDFRRSSIGDQLFKLRIFWLAPDFEAGNVVHEEIVRRQLNENIYNDILLSVVFGHIANTDIRTFLRTPGYPGVNFAILTILSEHGFMNYPWLSKKIGVSTSKLRETMPYVLGSGFADSKRNESLPFLTRRGRLFLEIVRAFEEQWQQSLSAELLFILRKLDIEPRPIDVYRMLGSATDNFPSLLYHLEGAKRYHNLNLSALEFGYEEKTIRDFEEVV